jgi:hypothetical protein
MTNNAPPDEGDEACLPIGLDADGVCVAPAGDEADALFTRVGERQGTPEDSELFHATVIQRFCDRVYAGEAVEGWILNLLADGFFATLMGAEWEYSFPLPGRPRPSVRTERAERNLKRDIDIYREVGNSMRAGAGINTEDAIEAVACKHGVSFGTARAAYYRLKNYYRLKKCAE